MDRLKLAHYIRDRSPPTVLVVTSDVLNPTEGQLFMPKQFDPRRVLGQIEQMSRSA